MNIFLNVKNFHERINTVCTLHICLCLNSNVKFFEKLQNTEVKYKRKYLPILWYTEEFILICTVHRYAPVHCSCINRPRIQMKTRPRPIRVPTSTPPQLLAPVEGLKRTPYRPYTETYVEDVTSWLSCKS